MITKLSTKFLAAALLFGAACSPPDQLPLDSRGAANVQVNGDELNGSVFNGAILNGAILNGAILNGAILNGAILNGAILNGAILNGTTLDGATVSGDDLVGLVLKGALSDGSSVDLRIDGITHDNVYKVDWYKVAVSLNAGDSWGPLCADGSSALVLENRWSGATGDLISDSTMFTFACDNAALAKCRKFGYDPSATRNECDGSGNCKEQSVQAWHQACTRMVRADYCGNGVSHTRNGTTIDIYDNLNIQTRDGNVGTLEADWSADGARCIRKTRFVNASGAGSDRDYVFNHCPSRLASEDASCGGDPNTGADSTDYPAAKGYGVDLEVRHLLRNDSVGNLQ